MVEVLGVCQTGKSTKCRLVEVSERVRRDSCETLAATLLCRTFSCPTCELQRALHPTSISRFCITPPFAFKFMPATRDLQASPINDEDMKFLPSSLTEEYLPAGSWQKLQLSTAKTASYVHLPKQPHAQTTFLAKLRAHASL